MINEYKTQQLLDFASTSRRHLTRNPITAVKESHETTVGGEFTPLTRNY